MNTKKGVSHSILNSILCNYRMLHANCCQKVIQRMYYHNEIKSVHYPMLRMGLIQRFFTLHWTDKSCFEKGARYDHDFITEKMHQG